MHPCRFNLLRRCCCLHQDILLLLHRFGHSWIFYSFPWTVLVSGCSWLNGGSKSLSLFLSQRFVSIWLKPSFSLISHVSKQHFCLVMLPSACSELEIVLNAWWIKPGFCQIVLRITTVKLNLSFHLTSASFSLTPFIQFRALLLTLFIHQ